MARVLVLGGDGMLGGMVRTHLAADPGFEVDWTSRHEQSGAMLFRAELSRTLFEIAPRRGGYDYMINCIGILRNAASGADSQATAEAIRINALFPHELAQIATEMGARLVHISTDAVFAAESGRCLESDVPTPTDLYGRTKLLGEILTPNAVTIRCSIIGPNPARKTGLVEWVLGQPRDAVINGYDDQLWNGVTTLQFAKLCATIFKEDLFGRLREESAIHHFCPNALVTKYELVQLLCRRFRPDIRVKRAAGGVVNRILETRGTLREISGTERPMSVAIDDLSTYIDGPTTVRG